MRGAPNPGIARKGSPHMSETNMPVASAGSKHSPLSNLIGITHGCLYVSGEPIGAVPKCWYPVPLAPALGKHRLKLRPIQKVNIGVPHDFVRTRLKASGGYEEANVRTAVSRNGSKSLDFGLRHACRPAFALAKVNSRRRSGLIDRVNIYLDAPARDR